MWGLLPILNGIVLHGLLWLNLQTRKNCEYRELTVSFYWINHHVVQGSALLFRIQARAVPGHWGHHNSTSQNGYSKQQRCAVSQFLRSESSVRVPSGLVLVRPASSWLADSCLFTVSADGLSLVWAPRNEKWSESTSLLIRTLVLQDRPYLTLL